MARRIYVDMDGVLCDFETAIDRDKARYPDIPYPQNRPGFYENLVPINKAIEAMNRLKLAKEIEPYILTAPSLYNPVSYMEKRLWVEHHLGFDWVNKLIISLDKSLLIGDLLVDDHTHGRGQEKFSGQLIHFGQKPFSDWNAVLPTLLAE